MIHVEHVCSPLSNDCITFYGNLQARQYSCTQKLVLHEFIWLELNPKSTEINSAGV